MGGAPGIVTLHNLHEARNLREVCFAPGERETEAEMPEPGPPVNDSLEQRACLISDPSPHPATGSLKGGLVSLYFNSWMCPGKDQLLPIRCQAWQAAGHCFQLRECPGSQAVPPNFRVRSEATELLTALDFLQR